MDKGREKVNQSERAGSSKMGELIEKGTIAVEIKRIPSSDGILLINFGINLYAIQTFVHRTKCIADDRAQH